MKKIILIVTVIVVIIGCNTKEKNNKEFDDSILEKNNPPRTRGEYNKNVYFNIDLRNRNYQPIHIESSSIRGFSILGSFDKASSSQRSIIDFYLHNLHLYQKKYVNLEKVEYNTKNGDTVFFKVFMKTSKKHKDITIPQIIDKLTKHDIIDLKLYLNGIEYEDIKTEIFNASGEDPKNLGNHICKSVVAVED